MKWPCCSTNARRPWPKSFWKSSCRGKCRLRPKRARRTSALPLRFKKNAHRIGSAGRQNRLSLSGMPYSGLIDEKKIVPHRGACRRRSGRRVVCSRMDQGDGMAYLTEPVTIGTLPEPSTPPAKSARSSSSAWAHRSAGRSKAACRPRAGREERRSDRRNRFRAAAQPA